MRNGNVATAYRYRPVAGTQNCKCARHTNRANHIQACYARRSRTVRFRNLPRSAYCSDVLPYPGYDKRISSRIGRRVAAYDVIRSGCQSLAVDHHAADRLRFRRTVISQRAAQRNGRTRNRDDSDRIQLCFVLFTHQSVRIRCGRVRR